MVKLAVLDEPRTFPPNRLLLIVWGLTFLISLFGLVADPHLDRGTGFWVAIFTVAAWQMWTTRWVQVDGTGISLRNIFGRTLSLGWSEITDFREEEFPMHKRSYVTLRISNASSGAPRPTKLAVTSDQVGFETLRTIIREAVAEERR